MTCTCLILFFNVVKCLGAVPSTWGWQSCTPITFETGVVVAVSAWHIIPSVTMPGTKSVNTVFVFPVVRLPWSPEPKTTYLFVCPYKGALHTSVIKANPRSLSVVTMLNVDVLFLIVNCYQIGTHRRTVWLSSQPWRARTTCEVTVTTKIIPSWLANICDKDKTTVQFRNSNTFGPLQSIFSTGFQKASKGARNNREAREMKASIAKDWGRGNSNCIVRLIR